MSLSRRDLLSAVQRGVTLQELMALGDWNSYRMVLRYAHFAPANAAGAGSRGRYIRSTGAQAVVGADGIEPPTFAL